MENGTNELALVVRKAKRDWAQRLVLLHAYRVSENKGTETIRAAGLLRAIGFEMDEYRKDYRYPMAEKKAKWQGFCDIPITNEDVHKFRDWGLSADDISGLVTDALSEGYKLGVFWDTYNEKVTCSMTCNDPSSPNAGYTFSSTGPDWFEAVAFSLYKHYVIAHKDWKVKKMAKGSDYT